MPWVRPTEQVLRQLVREWSDDRVTGLAAEMAFFGILSVFPGLLAIAAAVGSLEAIAGADAARRAQQEVVEALQRVLTSEADPLLDSVNALFAEASAGVLTVAAVGAVVAMSRGFAAVIRALNVAYDHAEGRSWWRTRLLAVAMSLASVIVLAVILTMVVLGPLFGRGEAIAAEIGLGEVFAFLWDWVRLPFAFVALVLWAATVYHLAPSHRSPWRWDLPGAVLAAALWVLVSFGFRLYLDVAGEGNQVFGILGGGLIMLMWLYLLSIGLLLGGELNAILSRRAGVLPRPLQK